MKKCAACGRPTRSIFDRCITCIDNGHHAPPPPPTDPLDDASGCSVCGTGLIGPELVDGTCYGCQVIDEIAAINRRIHAQYRIEEMLADVVA